MTSTVSLHKEKNMYCIYRITNLINGKTYIGQHKYKDTPYDSYMGSGILIKAAIKKYGIDNFIKDIIVAGIEDKETISKLEIKYIAYERSNNGNGCYNLAAGGEGCGELNKGKHHLEETKQKMSEAHKNKPHSEEWNRKVAKANKGKHRSEETRKKLSESHKNHLVSEETRKKMSKRMRGNQYNKRKLHSEEHKKRISEKMKGHNVSEETRKKLSNSLKGKLKGLHWKLVDGKRVWY